VFVGRKRKGEKEKTKLSGIRSRMSVRPSVSEEAMKQTLRDCPETSAEEKERAPAQRKRRGTKEESREG
jgi:hypothetical protein